MIEITIRNIQIENHANTCFTRHLHPRVNGWQRKLRGFGMKMLGGFDARRETAAHLLRGKLPVDIGKHVDAAFSLRVDGNPGERRLLALYDFDACEVQPVIGEGFRYQASALVVADEPKPAGARAEARDLREIVAGNAAGVNLQPIGIDLLVCGEESRNDREIVDATASDSHDLRGHASPWMPLLIVAAVRACQEKSRAEKGAGAASETAASSFGTAGGSGGS